MQFLIDKSFVAQRTRILRNDYMLTTTELALLLGFKRKTSITAIESGRSTPSYEIMMHIVQLFGVSANWLMGYSNVQYDENVLSCVEKICPVISAADLDISEITSDYTNLNMRKEKYSYWTRANIIYLRNLVAENSTELKDITASGKIHLQNFLSGKMYVPVFGQLSAQIEKLLPIIKNTFTDLGISVITGYRSLKLMSILGLSIDFNMENDDIIFFCIEHYDGTSGSACFFIEKVYPVLKEDSRIQSDKSLREKLEVIWQKAYKIRDQYIPQ